MNGNMELIDFNSDNFNGFEEGEEILLDTGILLAYLNEYDAWFSTVKKLFEKHIFNNDKTMFLFVNPGIIDETTHVSKAPLKYYLKSHPKELIAAGEASRVTGQVLNSLQTLIENDVLLVLDGDKNSVLKQMKLSEKLGSADAQNASLADAFGINFITVDGKLANNMKEVEDHLADIPKVYFTRAKHRDFR